MEGGWGRAGLQQIDPTTQHRPSFSLSPHPWGSSPCQDSGFLLLFSACLFLSSGQPSPPVCKMGRVQYLHAPCSTPHSASSVKETWPLEAVSSWEKGCPDGGRRRGLVTHFVWKVRYQQQQDAYAKLQRDRSTVLDYMSHINLYFRTVGELIITYT